MREQADIRHSLMLVKKNLIQWKLLLNLNDGEVLSIFHAGLQDFLIQIHRMMQCIKGAIEVVSRILAVELGARKIRVNYWFAPGAYQTDFNAGTVRDNEIGIKWFRI
ncbi:hypothetical protein FQR65_LT17596 [Abscondita terminalis]|nr:hypothetical protein FQR65_LT17596 [Abscondita terminalis]